MRITVVRLRRGVLILGGLLVVILISFLAYAHFRVRHFERDLPAQLGVNIQQTANGYTYSQSSGGHTLFTIHASKLIQFRRGGNAALHDVSITLYGPPGSKRTDKIYGANFDYDAKDQIVRAEGRVEIDLQGFGSQTASGANAIHVETSGLVFNQKTGMAQTNEYTEFAFPKASGSAVGASYDSRTGVLALDSRVRLKTLASARPMMVQATHAVLLRASNQALMTNPQTEYQGEYGSADAAVVQFRADGSAQSIHAQGHVRMVTAGGAVIQAANSLTHFDAMGQPVQTDMDGNVAFTSATTREAMRGTADSGTLFFGPDSRINHAQFLQNVYFATEIFGSTHAASGKARKIVASRRLEAAVLDVNFAPGPAGGRVVAENALASGGASIELVSTPVLGAPQRTTVSANQLLARFTPNGHAIRQLNGRGHTRLVEVEADDSVDTSTGDTLQIVFSPVPNPKNQRKKRGSTLNETAQIETAVQDGRVVLTQTAKPKPGYPTPEPITAWAQQAAYDGSTQVMRLTGHPRLDDGRALQLSATRIDFHRNSGDAAAFGDVRATYTESPSAPQPSGPTLNGEGPVHITASEAVLRRVSGVSIFRGSKSVDARMWQSGDAILAPVIELTRSPATLSAHGMPGNQNAAVEAVLTSANGAGQRAGTMQVRSRTLEYSETARRGDFRGEVTARNADGVIRANRALVYLAPAPKEKGAASGRQTQLERIVATGDVRLAQPCRTGSGAKLVYTAANGRYVLTGTPASPPRIVDAARGVTTGSALIFNSRNDSVLVSGGPSNAITTTRAPQ